MKAKIRGHNLPTQWQSDLEKAARQFIDDYIDDYIKKLQYRKEKGPQPWGRLRAKRNEIQ